LEVVSIAGQKQVQLGFAEHSKNTDYLEIVAYIATQVAAVLYHETLVAINDAWFED